VERRQERYALAARHLEKAIELAPHDWRYVNNLGNVLLLGGEADRALATYARAAEVAPSEPLIRVNEAQAWVQKLQFNRADAALAEANRLGYRLPPLLSSDADDVIVRDRTLSSAALWSRFLHGEASVQALGWDRIISLLLALPFPLAPFWMSLPLFAVLGYVGMARKLPRAFWCDTCGKAICRKCHYRVQRQSLCAHCYAIRRDVKAPLVRQSMLQERRRRVTRWSRILTLVTAVLVPGAGHVVRGRRGPGRRLLVLATIVFLTATAGVLWPDPSADHPGGKPMQLLIALALIYGLLAVFSFRGALRAPVRRATADDGEASTAPSGGH
jgi:hypothetical protein